MSAANVVMEARAAGIQLRVEGDDLLLKAGAPPSPAVLELLSRHKPAIVLWLRSGEDGWSAEDWHVFFDERAGIAEFDGGLPRPEAEARAFECCVVEWMNRTFERSPPGRCARCRRPASRDAGIVPFGVGDQHTWLHPGCWDAWHRDRRSQAAGALSRMGIHAGSRSVMDGEKDDPGPRSAAHSARTR